MCIRDRLNGSPAFIGPENVGMIGGIEVIGAAMAISGAAKPMDGPSSKYWVCGFEAITGDSNTGSVAKLAIDS